MPPLTPGGQTAHRPRPRPKPRPKPKPKPRGRMAAPTRPRPPTRNPGSYTQSSPVKKKAQHKKVKRANAAARVMRENREHGFAAGHAPTGGYTPRRRTPSSEMPGSELRTQSARDWRNTISAQSHGLFEDTLAGVVGTGRALYEGADLLTGIPSFIEDPSLENAAWAASNFVPLGFLGRNAAKGAKFGMTAAKLTKEQRVAKALERPVRTRAITVIQDGVPVTVNINAADSWLGVGLEKILDKVRPKGATRRRQASEVARSGKNYQAVKSAPVVRLQRIGRRFRADKQTALRVLAENQPLAAQRAYHHRMAAAALARGDRATALYHSMHEDLVKQVQDAGWIHETPTGPVLAAGAPKDLRLAWGLFDKSTILREDIYRALGQLTDEQILNRINAPGELVSGWARALHGRSYIPDRIGMPGIPRVGLGLLARKAEAVIRAPGAKRAIRGAVRDPSINHSYTGALRATGFFRSDVTNLTAESVSRALKADSVRHYRDFLLSFATETRQGADWLPVVVDVTRNMSPEMKLFFERLDAGGLSKKEIERMFGGKNAERSYMEQVIKEMFPDEAAAMVHAADGSLVPDPNIRWVPPEYIDRAAVLNPYSGMVLQSGRVGKAAGTLVDAFNDLNRFAILYLNPAYGLVNLLGNTAMNLIHQGIFLPRNIIRATKWAYVLSHKYPEAMDTVRGLMGTSKTHTFDLRSAGLKDVLGRIGSWISVISDSGPRWTAFVHEAGKAGMADPEIFAEVASLARAGNPKALQKLDFVARKAKDAIVDYDRMSPIERNVIARIIFFYPWLRGAARYTVRMPVDRPLTTAALGYAGYKAHEYQQDTLGDVPWYSQWDIPIPGMEDAQGNPYVFAPRQLVTPSAPIEAGQAIGNAITGNPDGQQLAGMFTPFLGAALGALTGVDEMGRPVPRGIKGLGMAAYENLPPKRLYEDFTRSDEENQKKLYPRTTLDNLIRLPLGGLAPKPYNKKVAGEIQARKGAAPPPPPPSYQQLYDWALRQNDKLVTKKAKGHVRSWQRGTHIWKAAREGLAEQMGLLNQDGTPSVSQLESINNGRELYALKLAALMKIRPGKLSPNAAREYRKTWERGDEKEIEKLKTWINEQLSYSDVYGRSLEGIIDELAKKNGFKPKT